jgi:hypothetical protein
MTVMRFENVVIIFKCATTSLVYIVDRILIAEGVNCNLHKSWVFSVLIML